MFHLLNRTYLVYRRTAFILDQVVLSSVLTADRVPASTYVAEVAVDYAGAGLVGDVIVSGTVVGAPRAQTLKYTGVISSSGTVKLSSTLRFDAGTSITVDPRGWGVFPTVRVTAINMDGSHLKILYIIQNAWPGRVHRRHGSLTLGREGTHSKENPYIFLPISEAYEPNEGDELVDSVSGKRWRIESKPLLDDGGAGHHWECPVQPNET